MAHNRRAAVHATAVPLLCSQLSKDRITLLFALLLTFCSSDGTLVIKKSLCDGSHGRINAHDRFVGSFNVPTELSLQQDHANDISASLGCFLHMASTKV